MITKDIANCPDKTVCIVGGGNSGVEGALLAAGVAKKVYLVHRRNEFRADQVTVDKLKDHENIETILRYVPVEIRGNECVTSLVIEHVESKERRELPTDLVFIQVGLKIPGDLTDGMVELNDKKEIIVDGLGNTKTKGLFAAGDVTTIPYKQTIVSAGEGVKAGLEAVRYLTGKKVIIDWTH